MDLFGYLAPSVVTTTADEYRACREAAALMDFSMLRKVDIEGPGAVELMNGIVTRDLAPLATGRIAYGALTDEHGKMIDDCTCMIRSSDAVRFCGANDRDCELFSARAAGTGIVVSEMTEALPHLCLQGPASRGILERLTDADISGPAFPYYTFREDVEIAGIPVFMTRLGYTAELGFELWVERARCLELWDALIDAGEDFGMRVIGMDALDLFRIEGGFIIGGVEYDPAVSPFECGLGWSVDFAKPTLPARAALERERDASRARLASVVLESGGADATDARLLIDGVDAGYVTQAIVSPYLDGATLGLAKVDRDHASPGTRIEARVGEASVPGRIVRHPVYDPERRRAKETS
jgi:glycine cleavage system aminomethyltransferase T